LYFLPLPHSPVRRSAAIGSAARAAAIPVVLTRPSEAPKHPDRGHRRLEFHHTADKIGEAAKARDPDAVLEALSETLATCTSCHQTFKQQVVDDAAWTASTKGSGSAGPMAH
jgi:hypothetical protein